MVRRWMELLCMWLLVILLALCTRAITELMAIPSLDTVVVNTTCKRDFISSSGLIPSPSAKSAENYSNEYDVFADNMTAYQRILYVQHSYSRLDTEARGKRFEAVLDALNREKNHLDREVVFQEMAETGLGNSLLALASSFMVSRLLNASFHGKTRAVR